MFPKFDHFSLFQIDLIAIFHLKKLYEKRLILSKVINEKCFFPLIISNRPFPHSTSVRTNNRTIARLGWTFSYICCIFVHPNLDSVPLFVGMRERSIDCCQHAVTRSKFALDHRRSCYRRGFVLKSLWYIYSMSSKK